VLGSFNHAAFAEHKLIEVHLKSYKEKFGKYLPYVAEDRKYRTRENQKLL